jgi:hypothetical protein
VANGLFAAGLGDNLVANMAALPASLAPATGKRAYVRVWFSPSGNTGTFQALSPDTEMRSVPFAREAGSVAGIATANLPQLNAANTFNNVSGITVQGSGPVWDAGTSRPVPANGTMVPSGGGSRMEFLPGCSAFRAGYVNNNQWDLANIGMYSTATGYDTTASGQFSTAMGYNTTASGTYSTTWGIYTEAKGLCSTALGASTTASGDYSWASGYFAKAIGKYSTAWDENTTASGDYSWARGYFAKAIGKYSTAWGANTTASDDYCWASGNWSTASALYSTSIGDSTVASGIFSTAIGKNNTASGWGSTAIGQFTTASGDYSTAIGDHTTAPSYAETALGCWNTTYTPVGLWSLSAGDRLLVVGNGTSDTRSDAFIINKRGDAWLAGTLLQASDRTKKTDIVAVDTATILAGVASLPIATWRYKNDTATHLGPMAQDFAAAFHLAGTDTSIASVDADGVALAAIQELKKQLDAKEARLAAVEADNAAKDEAIAALAADNAELSQENGQIKATLAKLAARLTALEAKRP